MNQQRNKVNNEMGATETEKATQGAETSSTGTGRKVTPPTLAQQWEALAARYERYALSVADGEDYAMIALEIRHAIREGLPLDRLAAAASRIEEDMFYTVKGATESSPSRAEIMSALHDSSAAIHLLHETALAQRDTKPETDAAPVRAEPLERSTPDHLVNLVSLTTVLSNVGCDSMDADHLPDAYEAGAHALASVNENGMGHRSARASTVEFAGWSAEVLGSIAKQFSGQPDRKDVDCLNTMLSLAEDIATVVRSVRDAAIAAEVSK